MNEATAMPDICDLLPMVRSIVRRLDFRADHRTFLDHEDLVQEGLVGLLEAAQRFDPVLGAPLSSFAYRRIRGAMLDAITKAQRQRQVRRRFAATHVGPSNDKDDERFAVFHGQALKEALADLDDLQCFFITGQIQEESDRDRCAEVGLTYWQYRGRRLRTLARLREHIEKQRRARSNLPCVQTAI